VELADRLAALKPLRAVVGNCDGGDLRRMFPVKLRWNCEGADVLMTHIGGYPGRYDRSIINQLLTRPPKLFVCGHSHILKVQYDQRLQLLHINPGAAGLQGWHQVRTLVRFTVDSGNFRDLEVIEIPRTESGERLF
jgi:predicted phosphodiesterase